MLRASLSGSPPLEIGLEDEREPRDSHASSCNMRARSLSGNPGYVVLRDVGANC